MYTIKTEIRNGFEIITGLDQAAIDPEATKNRIKEIALGCDSIQEAYDLSKTMIVYSPGRGETLIDEAEYNRIQNIRSETPSEYFITRSGDAIHRLEAMTAAEIQKEKSDRIYKLKSEAVNLRSRLEIEGFANALEQTQTWLSDMIANLEEEYKNGE